MAGSETELPEHEAMALWCLAQKPDCIGLIDTEEKMAAALTYVALVEKALAIATIGADGPTYQITPKGVSVIHKLVATP
jgi:hypothetical protein